MGKDQNVLLDREKYVGGSDIPVIMGLSPYQTPFELAKEKAGIIERESVGNAYTEYGEILEPIIRDYINRENNHNFQPSGVSRIYCNSDAQWHRSYQESYLHR